MRSRLVFVLMLMLVPGLAFAEEAAAPAASADHDAQVKAFVDRLLANVANKKADIVAKNMALTPEEAAKFWPVYEKYQKERTAIGQERARLLKEYDQAYETMDQKKANQLLAKSLDRQAKIEQVRRKYVTEFQKVLSPQKTVRFYFIDHYVDTLLEASLISEVPIKE